MKITPQHLREKAEFAEELGYRDHANLLRDAAETIEVLQSAQCIVRLVGKASVQPASTALVAAPSPQSTVDAVQAVANFLKERDESVLPDEVDDAEREASARCILRVVAKSPSSDRAASEVVERLKELADYLDIHHFASDRHKAADMVSRARAAIVEAKGSGQ